jgi:hypothetical protein
MSNILKHWNFENFDVSQYEDDNLKNRKNTIKNTCGNDKTGLCIYSYNELGFRGDSIHKKGFKIMSIGCSYVEGIGVNDNETFSHYFSKLILNGVDLNFGFGGRSNDYIVRCLMTFYDIIIPDLVIITYTHKHRREYMTKDNIVEPFMPTSTWNYMENDKIGINIHKNLVELQNDYEDMNNWYKNHLLIKYFLESKKCNWIWTGPDTLNDYTDFNKFNGDFEKVEDFGVDGIHAGPKTNKTYAHNLFNYILKNHLNFLPKELNNLPKIL